MVTMAALRKFVGFEMFKLLILSKLSSGFSAFRKIFGEKIAGNSSWVEKSEGLSEGRDGVQAKIEGCAISADWDLGRGILHGRRCFWRYCSC